MTQAGQFVIRKAQRSRVKLRIRFSSPSGGGKTRSAIRFARGFMNGDMSKVVVIDTEQESSSLYADGEFSTLLLEPPFAPERYIDAIKYAESQGFELCIIDSATHEWNGPGGCLSIVDQIKAGAKNQWTEPWGVVSKKHDQFIQTLLQCHMHVIATTRRKQDFVQGADKKVRKVGLAEQQRDGFDYEFTLGFDINSEHVATADKDRTGLFNVGQFADSVPFIITEEIGAMVRLWNESGAEPLPVPVEQLPPPPPQAVSGASQPVTPTATTPAPAATPQTGTTAALPTTAKALHAALFKDFTAVLGDKDQDVLKSALAKACKSVLPSSAEYRSFMALPIDAATTLWRAVHRDPEAPFHYDIAAARLIENFIEPVEKPPQAAPTEDVTETLVPAEPVVEEAPATGPVVVPEPVEEEDDMEWLK